MDEERGTGLTGFLRLSVTVLREGDVPKIHSAKDLEQDLEPDIGLVINLPDLETEAFLLTVIINKVEVAPFGLDTPTMQVRIRFGATEIKSRVLRRGFEQIVNDELRFPIYQPTLTDRISIEARARSARPIAAAARSSSARPRSSQPQFTAAVHSQCRSAQPLCMRPDGARP
jgi:hypothetical protein